MLEWGAATQPQLRMASITTSIGWILYLTSIEEAFLLQGCHDLAKLSRVKRMQAFHLRI